MTTTAFPFIVQGSNITVVIGTTSHTVSKSHVAYAKVLDAIKTGNWDLVKDIIEPKKAVLKFGAGNISIEGDKIFWKSQEMHNALTKRMVQMIHEDFPVTALVAFMENLMKNPSKRAVDELYGFLEKNSLPITEDGFFLGYKKVDQNYLDIHSKTVLNKPAQYLTDEEKASLPLTVGQRKEVTVALEGDVLTVSMERNQVDDDQNRTCSNGLHICSKDYLPHFGSGYSNRDHDRVVIVKINPADVVSVPNDYNNAKLRCSKYAIVDEIDKEKVDEAFTKAVQAKAEKEASTLTPKEIKDFVVAFNGAAAAKTAVEQTTKA